MAVGKQSTRRITIRGDAFRWRCDFNHPTEMGSVSYARNGVNWPPDKLVIRPEEGPHRLLTVVWPACLGPLVTPALVKACIQEAQRRGWLVDSAVMEIAGREMES